MASLIERIWALVSPRRSLRGPRPSRLGAARCRCGLASIAGYACYCDHGTTYTVTPSNRWRDRVPGWRYRTPREVGR